MGMDGLRKKCLPHRHMSRQKSRHTQDREGHCGYYSKSSSICITQMDTTTAILDGEEWIPRGGSMALAIWRGHHKRGMEAKEVQLSTPTDQAKNKQNNYLTPIHCRQAQVHAMVKKQQLAVGVLTSLFSSSNKQRCHSSSSMSSSSSSSSAWQWTSCGLHPRTLSFRQQQQEEEDQNQHVDNDSHMGLTKQQATMNSAYSCFSPNSLASIDSFSMASSDAAEADEAVIRAVRSDRLLFEPEEASSFKEAAGKADKPIIKDITTMSKQAAFGGATAMSVESLNPYRDFRESMEAMVMSQGGARDWHWLEEMLGWFLRANGKSTHGLIVGAFVDLLVALSTDATSPADSSSSPATPAAANCRSSSSDCSCSSL